MSRRQWSIILALIAVNCIVLLMVADIVSRANPPPASPTVAALATPTVTPTLTPTPEPPLIFPDIIPITRPVNTVFILDASGSMTSRIAGRPKMDIAKDVMTQLVEKLPANIRAGIRVYGKNFGGTDAERPQSCQDIELLAPLGDPNKATLIARVRGITPRGWTPIYGSLLSAQNDFVAGQDNNVILVSDGIETCGGDPCAAARQLRASGIALTIHVVGFEVDDATRTQLQCVANAASGQYYDAKSGQELANALNSAVNAVQIAAPAKVALLATATPTPTVAPTAPACVAQETLTARLADSVSAVTSAGAYSGPVWLSVSGVGQSSARMFSDAFYLYTDNAGNPITPTHSRDWVLWINRQPAHNLIAGQQPPAFRDDHAYTFLINAPGGRLTFGVGDDLAYDNSGSFTIRICGGAAPSPLPTATRTPTITRAPSATQIQVFANRTWQDTGIFIQRGKQFRVEYLSGQITDGGTRVADGNGSAYICGRPGCCEPIPNARRSAIIGKVGNEMFVIGNGGTFAADTSGTLALRVNDCDSGPGVQDNTGAFTVRIVP